MKKTIALFMTMVCLGLYSAEIQAFAEAPFESCPYCAPTVLLETRSETIAHGSTDRVFKDAAGNQVVCHETYTDTKVVKICNQKHGIVQEYIEKRETHSIASCPYNKQN